MSSAQSDIHPTRIGAHPLSDGSSEFVLWAPNSKQVSIRLTESNDLVPMRPTGRGYHEALVERCSAGRRYFFRLEDGRELPDPTSRFQPEGVHGPSEIADAKAFPWTDQGWKGRALKSSVIYELHVGTYSAEGTFDAVIPRLAELAALGVTTVELMPVAQFPGSRNWGYDGVYPYAPQNSYGGPEALRRLVNAAHKRGLAMVLDVVYNHLGPEGNYLNAFGPYFTDRYQTPWGQAINFDGQHSDEVRRFFIENALYWLDEFHFDALRLDAIHGIFDFSARHFLEELKSFVANLSARLGRSLYLIAESDLNNSRILRNAKHGGYGVDAQWSDDFHHSVHTLLTREDRGYYSDFRGIGPLAATLRDGWFYSGQYSGYRKRRHGNSAAGIAPEKFVVCTQNHDQVGNRVAGERLTALVGFEALKLAAGINILSPFVPMLFMGEEYGESAPFQYFTSHGDKDLVEAVRRGRREEFATFGWKDSVPDPQDEKTFQRSRLDHSLKERAPHQTLYRFYQELIHLRATLKLGRRKVKAVRELGEASLLVRYADISLHAAMLFNFAEFPVALSVPELAGNWKVMMTSASITWNGPEAEAASTLKIEADQELRISPVSFLVLEKIESPTESE